MLVIQTTNDPQQMLSPGELYPAPACQFSTLPTKVKLILEVNVRTWPPRYQLAIDQMNNHQRDTQKTYAQTILYLFRVITTTV